MSFKSNFKNIYLAEPGLLAAGVFLFLFKCIISFDLLGKFTLIIFIDCYFGPPLTCPSPLFFSPEKNETFGDRQGGGKH